MLGTLFVVLGTVGIFVPVLPTTPFLLLAAACYGKGSHRLYNWLMQNRVLGEYIRNYREGKGIPLFTKIFTLILLYLSIGCSAIFFVKHLLVRILLLMVAIGVTIHLLSIKTIIKTKKISKSTEGDLSNR